MFCYSMEANLEEIVKSRKLERRKIAKETQENGQQTINNRMRFQELPPETFVRLHRNQLWDVILDYLTNPLELYTCWASGAFRDQLGSKVLMEVFKILHEKKYLHAKFHKDNKFRNYAKKELQAEKSETLKLRLVSKSWKLAVESVFMNAFTTDWHLDPLDRLTNLPWWRRHLSVVHLSTPDDVDRALNVLQESSLQSICSLAGVVHVDDPKNVDLDLLHSKVVEFLDFNGSYVRALHFYSSSSEQYQRLLDYVRRTPNLKELVLSLNGKSTHIPDFPILPNLELINFDWFTKYEGFITQILRKSPSLKSLTLPPCLPVTHELIKVIKPLKLEHYKVNAILPGQNELLGKMDWPLRKFSTVAWRTTYGPSHMLRILERFSATLEHLSTCSVESVKDVLRLPKLRTLQLGIISGIYDNLDFVQGLGSIESIEIGRLQLLEYDDLVRKRNVFGSYYDGKIVYSNIWSVCPALKEIKAGYHSYQEGAFKRIRYFRP